MLTLFQHHKSLTLRITFIEDMLIIVGGRILFPQLTLCLAYLLVEDASTLACPFLQYIGHLVGWAGHLSLFMKMI